ncbi:hypothetical protein [Massilia sp.]|uniref:hypothetical protein n=1 Tax=Massilia sp. TaxID=1882437 RepID=UPI00289CFF06|nr:hypothetical protein [Massilia sp.]
MADTEREAFEAWHRSKFATRHSTGQPTRDMHNGIYAGQYGPAHQQQMWEAWQASALTSRPRVTLDPALKAALDAAARTGATSAVLPGGESVFINCGHDYGDNAHLECTACGGSGHIDDQRAALASRPAEVDDEGLPPLPAPMARIYAQNGYRHASVLPGLGKPLFTAEQYRQGQRDAVAADRAKVDRDIGLLREARAALETWKDVAPAVSLHADIDKVLAGGGR